MYYFHRLGKYIFKKIKKIYYLIRVWKSAFLRLVLGLFIFSKAWRMLQVVRRGYFFAKPLFWSSIFEWKSGGYNRGMKLKYYVSRNGKQFVAQAFGFITRPMNKMLPEWLSRIINRNGWSARKTGIRVGPIDVSFIVTAVAAAASVPSSFTST